MTNPNKPLSPTELKRLHRQWRRDTTSDISVILDGVQKPFNIGAVVRSAAAYRVSQIWLVPPALELSHPKVTKTALGCDRLVNWDMVKSGLEAVELAKKAGYATVAIELTQQSKPLFSVDLCRPVCLVLGHEERGVSSAVLEAVDHMAYAPQLGKVGSLNVAHAGSIALYEAFRQTAQNANP